MTSARKRYVSNPDFRHQTDRHLLASDASLQRNKRLFQVLLKDMSVEQPVSPG